MRHEIRRSCMVSHCGFTLIELMIVIAIIGILALFTLPAYQTYTKRTYVAEGLQLTAAHKSAVLSAFSVSGELLLPVLPQDVPADSEHIMDSNYAIGLGPPSTYSSAAVKQIFVAPGSKIIVQFNKKVIEGGTLTLFPNLLEGSIKWFCVGDISGDAGGFIFVAIPRKYLPAGCRDEISFGG